MIGILRYVSVAALIIGALTLARQLGYSRGEAVGECRVAIIALGDSNVPGAPEIVAKCRRVTDGR